MATRFTIADLVAQADATLPDNTTQEISAADVRNMVKNFLATMKPSFAAMRTNISHVIALNNVSPVIITPFDIIASQDPPEMTPTLVGGTIVHSVTGLGNTKVTDRITFFMGCSGTSGAELTFTVFVGGTPTDIVGRVSTTGAGNVVTAALSGLLTRTIDTTYTIRVQASNNANYTFTNGTFRVENVPVAA